MCLACELDGWWYAAMEAAAAKAAGAAPADNPETAARAASADLPFAAMPVGKPAAPRFRCEETGPDETGQGETGQDEAGQDETGQDETGRE